MKKNILLICLAMFLTSCFGDARLVLINQTNNEIVFQHDANAELETPMVNKTEFYLERPLKTNDSAYVAEYGGNWPNFFKRNKSKKLYMFIFNFDTLQRYNDIDYLVEHKLYRRLEFSKEELEQSNWEIILKD